MRVAGHTFSSTGSQTLSALTLLGALLLASSQARADDEPPVIASAASDDEPPNIESGAALAEPPAGVRPRRAAPLRPPADEAEPWNGPRVELGYAYYVLGDGFGGGGVNTFSFGGYLPTGRFRLGLIGEGGVRDYTLADDDAIVRGTLVAGWQGVGLVDYVMPYVAAVASAGFVVGQRFATTFIDALLGLGVEIGFEVNPVRTLHFGASLAHVRADLGGLSYGLWVLRLFAGL